MDTKLPVSDLIFSEWMGENWIQFVEIRQIHGACPSVRDELLRWHFRQSVLANMRGNGEPIFDVDFAGGDMMGEIRNGPKAAERMEVELFSRFFGYSQFEENDDSSSVTPIEECSIKESQAKNC